MSSVLKTLDLQEFFAVCLKLSDKYGLSGDAIKKDLEEMASFRVTTPIIGGFSTGKSSMINAILGETLLKTQITAETAVPTEIYYGKNRVFYYQNGQVQELRIEQFIEEDIDTYTTKLVKIEYNHDFLKQIPKVKIVDMPGFDSGIELHNKAIDLYLPNSLAYIVTFSADEPVIKESIANFLKELKLHEVPVYVVITKCDKVSAEELEENIRYFRTNIPALLGIKDVKIACVKSKRDKNVEEVKQFLAEIQQKSEQIFEENYFRKLKSHTSLVEKYIQSRLHNHELSSSELEQKEKELEKEVAEISLKLEKEKSKFETQLQKCIDSIKVKISSDLSSSQSTLEAMILNGKDITEKVNFIVRSAVIAGIKSEFEPKLQMHLKNVSELIQINAIMDTEIKIDDVKIATDTMVKDLVVKSLPVILATIGGVIAGGPIGAIIAGAIGIFIESFFKSKQEKEKRELAKQKVARELIPHIVDVAGSNVETELTAYLDQVNEEIQADIEKQKQLMKQALADVKKEKQKEEELQKEQLRELTHDLGKVREMVDGI
ncbi:dynamin family protein [Neobacillus pocheonensis]|uniref:dynamin family protein n=1 Tax=Neobacillus pocheonensis TaxID=363869 RepID=UPI003D2E6914